MKEFNELKSLETQEDKLEYIISLGQNNNKICEEKKDYKIIKCSSPAYLQVLGIGEDRRPIIAINSSSLIVKGLLTLLANFYETKSFRDILKDENSFLKEIDFLSLSLNRVYGIEGAILKLKEDIWDKVNENYSMAQILEHINKVIDPELGINIVDLGLIYDAIHDFESKKVKILMTLTTPMCPAGPQIIKEVKETLLNNLLLKNVEVELTFFPPWDPKEMASPEAKTLMGVW